MPIAVLEQVSKTYRLGDALVPAVRDLSLSIDAGEFTVFWGPSGSGKTTTLNLLGGLDQPTGGRVRIDDCDLATLSDNRQSDFRNRHIGFVFQDFHLLPVLSALDNVRLPLDLRGAGGRQAGRRAEACLRAVDLEAHAAHRPSQLSGGQKQRVCIARALATEPSLILADEPTANLDTENALGVIAIMRTLNEQQGVTFVFSTHDDRLLRFARRRIQLVDGRLAADERAGGKAGGA